MSSTSMQLLLIAGVALASACAPSAGESRDPGAGGLPHSRTFAQVDSGPSEDYGYTNPSTGAKYPPKPPGERHSRW